MRTLCIVPPLLVEPNRDALRALAQHPLFIAAEQLAQAHTGASLSTLQTENPGADWARARLRALAACLVQARDARASSPRAVVGLGLGEIGAWALTNVLSDAEAMQLLLQLSLALSVEEQVLALRVATDDALESAGVSASRLAEAELLFEGAGEAMERLLAAAFARDARVTWPLLRSASGSQRARLSQPLLRDARPRAPQEVLEPVGRPDRAGDGRSSASLLLCPSTGETLHTAPSALDARPFDLVRVLRAAQELGCGAVDVLGDELTPPPSLPRDAPLGAATAPGYYIGQVRERTANAFVSERELSLESEPYLRTAARLHKVSVLPGSFELEIGIEAGKLLHPELLPVAIENAHFHSALKLFEAQPVTLRLRADSKPLGDGYHQVTLGILSDLVHKSGRVLQRDRRHCDLTVIMGPHFDLPPEPIEWDARAATRDPDVPSVLYQPASPLWLGPYFEAVWDTERSGSAVRSVYQNPEDLTLPAFHAHLGAPLLMDAVLQNPLRRAGPFLATGIPLSIRRVRFFELINEPQIVARYGHLVLTSLVDDALPYCERMQAAAPDGRLLLDVERFETIPLGFIDRRDRSLHLTLPSQPTVAVPSAASLRG